jgi:plastocyanin
VTPNGGGPSSGTIKPGGTANHMFPGAGTFAYHDSLHPDLKGKVIVK